ncbi:nuclear transport factor 2 family protein [Nonomuraea purpurea]|uniref:Nuclear transport factor 2 family protein n=1 Tax=Nonomuraea purpurea TaxID=1849276 RepID=A0ABV8GLG9_9ACTN
MRTPIILVAAALTLATAAPAFADGQGATERRTAAFMEALERKNLTALSALLDPDVTMTLPLSFSGRKEDAARFTGKAEVLGYAKNAFAMFGKINFVNKKVTVSKDGKSSFVQADGDFTTADGKPYRNVYVYHFEWRDGRVIRSAEYGNPVTFCATFPATPGC